MHALRKRHLGVLLGGVAFVVMLAFVAVPTAQSRGFGKDPTIVGTNGPDVEDGTFGRDVIKTFAGNDQVRGDADFAGEPGGARGFICLGDGNDTADGAAKADRIRGGPGRSPGRLFSCYRAPPKEPPWRPRGGGSRP